jgi:CRISPR-associated protein Cst2
MRSTQLPHLVAIEGLLTTSTSAVPAPLISPLLGGDDQNVYRQQVRQQIEGIVSALNGSDGEVVQVKYFDTISEFATQMRTLIDSSSPFMLVPGN